MPYVISKQDEEFCVYKEGANGEPMGDSFGCYPTRAEAEEQMSALYAAESQKAEFSSITYNGITVQASGQRSSSRDDKKYERTVRYKGEEKVVHYGDPNMEIRRDNDEARESFNARHSCSEKKDPFSPGFWSCYAWKKALDEAEIAMTFAPFKTYKSSDGTEGVVEAPGVLFDSYGKSRDLDNEFFTGETYYGPHNGDGVDATLNHRQPIVTKDATANGILEQYAKYRFTNPVRAYKTNLALVGRHVLDLRNEFEAWVFEMAEKGAFSWSTATAPHMMDKKSNGEIVSWPIIEWAYTPTPAQPLNPTIMPVKSIKDIVFENVQLKEAQKSDPHQGLTIAFDPDMLSITVVDGTDEYTLVREDTKDTHLAEEEMVDDGGAAEARRKLEQEVSKAEVEIQQFELAMFIGEQ